MEFGHALIRCFTGYGCARAWKKATAREERIQKTHTPGQNLGEKIFFFIFDALNGRANFFARETHSRGDRAHSRRKSYARAWVFSAKNDACDDKKKGGCDQPVHERIISGTVLELRQ